MSLSKEEIELAYRLFLGRAPESEKVVNQHRKLNSTGELGAALLNSAEFRRRFETLTEQKSADNRKPVVIHLHIPKTAGTSFNRLLVESHEGEFALAYHESEQKKLLELPRSTRGNIDLIFGHMNWGIHQHLRRQHLYLFVLRVPRARVFSLHQYIKVAEDHPLHVRAKNISFSEFLDLSLEDVGLRWAIDNAQMLRVSGGRPRALDPVPDYRVEFRRACANAVSENCEYGFLDSYTDYILRMRNMGIVSPAVEIRRLNITGTGTLLEEELDKLSSDHSSLLDEYVFWDEKFYDFCAEAAKFIHENQMSEDLCPGWRKK